MENKYYTPELSEFHIGFIFQTQNQQKEWRKPTFFGNPEALDSINKLLKRGDVRVKYLDKEDIESLEFSIKPPTSEYLQPNDYYEKSYKDPRGVHNKIKIIHNKYSNWILITLGGDEITFEDEVTRFSGRIKNKSELIKLLKQLETN